MDNLEQDELERWTRECAALLAPHSDWEPDPNGAFARFEARKRQYRKPARWLLLCAAAAVFASLMIALVPSRGFAQAGTNHFFRVEQIWYWFTLVRPGPLLVARIPEDALSLHTQLVAETAPRVDFTPRLPHSGVLSANPRFSTLGPMSFETVVDSAELERALRKRGVTDQEVLQSWNGARITLNIGSTLTAEWHDVPDEWFGTPEWSSLTLTQGLPPVVATPTGFDLAAYTAVGLRIRRPITNKERYLHVARTGMNAAALLFDNELRRGPLGVCEVNLQSASATLIEDIGNNGVVDRVTLIWSVPGRAFALRGVLATPVSLFSLDMATALANLVDVANTIR